MQFIGQSERRVQGGDSGFGCLHGIALVVLAVVPAAAHAVGETALRLVDHVDHGVRFDLDEDLRISQRAPYAIEQSIYPPRVVHR